MRNMMDHEIIKDYLKPWNWHLYQEVKLSDDKTTLTKWFDDERNELQITIATKDGDHVHYRTLYNKETNSEKDKAIFDVVSKLMKEIIISKQKKGTETDYIMPLRTGRKPNNKKV